ncbi:MAG: HAMP domain-containing histidine kinase [Firmicutes bacterium]|nr:HAMP domain-containing histidine kinase [Bacillota bacterium]
MALCVLISAIYHLWTASQRYRRISELTDHLDRVLHQHKNLPLEEYQEGELAVLATELQKLLVRLEEQASLLQRDKTFLGDLIADISHQLRTPMTSLRLYTTLLQDPRTSEDKRKKIPYDISRLLDRMEWLIETLLKLSKLDSGTVHFRQDTVSVEQLIRQAAQLVEIPMELRGQELSIRLEGDETYTGDLSWSVEAVSNILKNCMEHMETGGSIEIAASETPIYTEITIRDHGLGIDQNDAEHLFERFYRGHNATSSSIGIGLALARMIIKEQNGTIRVENVKDGGALFTIRFYREVV